MHDAVELLYRGGQRLEGRIHRLGEGLHLLQGPLRLAPDDPGDRLVDDLAPGKPGIDRDPLRLQRERLTGGAQGAVEIGQRPRLSP